MKRSIDLFVDSDLPLEELAEELSELSGLAAKRSGDGSEWSIEQGEVRARLGTHPFLDDGDLCLSRYAYALSCRVPSETRLADAPETVLLRMVSEALQKGGVGSLLVHDLQYRDRVGVAQAVASPAPATEHAPATEPVTEPAPATEPVTEPAPAPAGDAA